jgi:hypothetical protein
VGKPLEQVFPAIVNTEAPAKFREVAVSGKPWQAQHLQYTDGVVSGAFEVYASRIAPGEICTMFVAIESSGGAATPPAQDENSGA